VTCYNRRLAESMAGQLAGYPSITVIHFHGWARECGFPWVKHQPDEEWAALFLEHMKAGNSRLAPYDAILVDEAQDFEPDWFRSLLAAASDPEAWDSGPRGKPAPDDPTGIYEGAAFDGGNPLTGLRMPLSERQSGSAFVMTVPSTAVSGGTGQWGEIIATSQTLDLGGQEIRAITWSPHVDGGRYLIVGGPASTNPALDHPSVARYSLWSWSGSGAPVLRIPDLSPYARRPSGVTTFTIPNVTGVRIAFAENETSWNHSREAEHIFHWLSSVLNPEASRPQQPGIDASATPPDTITRASTPARFAARPEPPHAPAFPSEISSLPPSVRECRGSTQPPVAPVHAPRSRARAHGLSARWMGQPSPPSP